MPVFRCPSCTAPLTDAEHAAVACPECAAPLATAPMAAPAIATPPPAPPRAPLTARPWWGLLVATAALAVPVVVWLTRPSAAGPASAEGDSGDGPAALLRHKEKDQAADRDLRARWQQQADLSAALQRRLDETSTALTDEARLRGEAERRLTDALARLTAAERGLSELSAAVEKLKDEAGAVRLSDPNGSYTVRALNDGDRVKLLGRVNVLRVTGVNGGTLDASGLEAKLIFFSQPINGASAKVKLHAPGGVVNLVGANAGRLTIDAPAGRVHCRQDINGEAEVQVRARTVQLDGAVNGTAKVRATLTAGGAALRFKLLQGSSRLTWKKERPTDPAPAITRGTVRGEAVFEDE